MSDKKHIYEWVDNTVDPSLLKTLPSKKLSKLVTNKLLKCYQKLLKKATVAHIKKTNVSLSDIISLEPTTKLFIMGPVSLNVIGITYEYIEELLATYGEIKYLRISLNATHVYVEYSNINSAIKCKEGLHFKMLPGFNPALNSYAFVDYAYNNITIDRETVKLPSELMSPPRMSRDQLNTFTWQWPKEITVPIESRPYYTNNVQVPGLLLIPDFVTEEEEIKLLNYCNTLEYDHYSNRDCVHFGHLDSIFTPGFPSEVSFLLDRIKELIPAATSTDYAEIDAYRHNHKGILYGWLKDIFNNTTNDQSNQSNNNMIQLNDNIIHLIASYSCSDDPNDYGFIPDQMHVNRYAVGGGIPPHVDVHSAFSDVIISLSLKSSLVMDFREYPNRLDIGKENKLIQHHDVLLPARSMAIMTGKARYVWTHGIACRMNDDVNNKIVSREERYSLTFRRVLKSGRCQCVYPESCDLPVEELELKQSYKRQKTMNNNMNDHDVKDDMNNHDDNMNDNMNDNDDDVKDKYHTYGHGIMGAHRAKEIVLLEKQNK